LTGTFFLILKVLAPFALAGGAFGFPAAARFVLVVEKDAVDVEGIRAPESDVPNWSEQGLDRHFQQLEDAMIVCTAPKE
jgi:hypothetical protein